MSDTLPMPHSVDRYPPHTIEGEQGVLGCILLDPKYGMPIAFEKLRLKLEPFYDLRHEAIFEALAGMYDRQELIDPIGVQQYLRDRNQLDALGGMPYIAGLMNVVPSAANLEYYIEMVNEKAYERRVIQVCTTAITKTYDGMLKGDDLSDFLESNIMALTQKTRVKPTRREVFERIIGNLERMNRGEEIPGLIKTGFPDLDCCLGGGVHPGDQVVIAARPGLGKSTLAMNIAEFNAIDCKIPVGYFSLEMSEEKLNTRSLASRSRIDLSLYRERDRKMDYETRAVSRVLSPLINAPIDIEFTPGISIMQLRSKARQMAHTSKIKLMIVDMLQLVTGRSVKRAQEVGEVSRGLKALAGELEIPIISVSSMNRDIEKDDNRRPRLSDLKESGDIESDADVVAFLWQKDPTAEENGVIETNMFIAKNRNGNTDEIKLQFQKRISRFESASKVSDVPHESSNRNPYPD